MTSEGEALNRSLPGASRVTSTPPSNIINQADWREADRSEKHLHTPWSTPPPVILYCVPWTRSTPSTTLTHNHIPYHPSLQRPTLSPGAVPPLPSAAQGRPLCPLRPRQAPAQVAQPAAAGWSRGGCAGAVAGRCGLRKRRMRTFCSGRAS